MPASDEAGCALYLLTPAALEDGFERDLARVLDAGPVAAVQLRLKGCDDDTIRRWADRLREPVQSRGVALMLNDRPDLAVETGCDGAHIGGEPGAVAAARRVLGDRQLGFSAGGSRDRAMLGAEAGADYVSFGPFFESATKPAEAIADVALLAWWAEVMAPPCVAIGGIAPDNCGGLVRAGADFLGVCGSVWKGDDPARVIADFARAIAEAA